jgi:SAM-dependent methyltransferase
MESEDWDHRYEASDLLWTATPNRFLVAEVEGLEPGAALDVGCGEGRNAVWLAEQGWRVTGVDFSDVGLDKARRLAAARGVDVEWVLADVRSYQPAEAAYDLAVVLYLHLPASERRAVHTAVARSLRPDGVLLVVGHDVANLSDGYGGPQDASILFTPDDVVGDLAGLSIEGAERVQRVVSTDDGERRAIDALVRAVRR